MTPENSNPDNKFLNPEEYSTIYVRTEDDEPHSKVANLIHLLTDTANKENRIEVLKILKEESGIELLIETIAAPEAKEVKAALIAACWETDLDCSKYLSFFVQLALEGQYLVAMEAITVIENMSGNFNANELSECRMKLHGALNTMSTEDAKIELLKDLEGILERFVA